jgi:hypothetical protein
MCASDSTTGLGEKENTVVKDNVFIIDNIGSLRIPTAYEDEQSSPLPDVVSSLFVASVAINFIRQRMCREPSPAICLRAAPRGIGAPVKFALNVY